MRSIRLSPKDMVLSALFAVLLAVCAWISVPTAVPFTLQTLGLFLAMGLLGGRRATFAVLVYLLLGLAGLPVFSGFRGGFAMLAGVTGGYLIGFLFAALCYWLVTARAHDALWPMILGMAAGLLTDYLFGTVWFMLLYARSYGAVGLSAAFMMCVVPFIAPDLIKLGIAVALVKSLRGRVKALQP